MTVRPRSEEAIWHDVECGGYTADLALWDELAAGAAGSVLELGAGTGRVALHLAAAGREVVAVDSSPALLDELRDRAAARGLAVETVCADARTLTLERRFGAVIAPMQLLQVLGGPARRRSALAAVRRHLAAGGRFAAAVLGDHASSPAEAGPPPLPDVREIDGWVYSSLPVAVIAVDGGLEIRRLRQRVSPAGELADQTNLIHLDELSASGLEREAERAGLRPVERVEIAATDDHVGSVVCVAEAC